MCRYTARQSSAWKIFSSEGRYKRGAQNASVKLRVIAGMVFFCFHFYYRYMIISFFGLSVLKRMGNQEILTWIRKCALREGCTECTKVTVGEGEKIGMTILDEYT